jgi:hypothetical protein
MVNHAGGVFLTGLVDLDLPFLRVCILAIIINLWNID